MFDIPSWIYDQRLGFALLAIASIRLFDANEHAACCIADCPDLEDALETPIGMWALIWWAQELLEFEDESAQGLLVGSIGVGA
ncbi:hypothetical protein ACLOJK_029314 [Asimina triloba]